MVSDDLLARFQRIADEMSEINRALQVDMEHPCDVDVLKYCKSLLALSERVTPDVYALMSKDTQVLMRQMNPDAGK